MHPSLRHAPADLIAGTWQAPLGVALTSHNPARPSAILWSGTSSPLHVDRAVDAARAALAEWSRAPFEFRAAILRTFASLASQHADDLTALIRDEVGKPTWDAKSEAQLLASKVEITLEQGPHAPLNRVSGYELPLGGTKLARCWFRPHGVLAVLGPFNFPAHLPNGHIIPALAMGNTIVFKPSDKAPATGQLLAELLHEALETHLAPKGVLNLVQGGADVATRLVSHPDLDGILFTGSWPVGRKIMEANLDRPGRILALEMGGNNAAIILPDADLRQAVIECVRCAFMSTGQRCTATRRVIIHESVAGKVIPAIAKAASALIVGDPAAPHPVFMGPLISEPARQAVLDAQHALAHAGGEPIVPCTPIDTPSGGWFLSPGVMRVDRFVCATNLGFVRSAAPASTDPATPGSVAPSTLVSHPGADLEVFGPFLRVSTAKDFDDALTQANATRFGLAASLFTRDEAAIERFRREARAGCININCGTAGASSKLPFGGLGLSGNHRPAGAFSLDYCAMPIAGLSEQGNAAAIAEGMRFDDHWLPA
jgi:succinylglutamic semialdehyde dehydrogenase